MTHAHQVDAAGPTASPAAPRAFRVLHVVPALFASDGKVVGGAERFAFETARAMADEVPTTLVSFADEDKELFFGPLRVRLLGRPWKVRGNPFNPVSWKLLEELRRADVVHCHQQHVLTSSIAAAYCRLTGKRVFVTELGGGGWDVSAYVSTDRWYNGHLHLSRYSRQVFGHDGAPWARIVGGGVDTSTFTPDDSVARVEALFVGRLLPHKGVDYLVDAVPSDLPLRVIGRAVNERYFADLQALAAGKRVTFAGVGEDADLVHAYRRAMCFVLPSVYVDRYGVEDRVPELLGLVLLEAMACGAPAICTNVASMPEVVVDGVTGFIVPPNDVEALRERLVWIRDHPERAREMGIAGRQRVLNGFTWRAVAERCLAAYDA